MDKYTKAGLKTKACIKLFCKISKSFTDTKEIIEDVTSEELDTSNVDKE